MCDGFTSEDSAAVWAEMEMNLCWCKVHVQYDSHMFFVSILWGCVGTNRHTKNHHLPKEDVPLLKSYCGCIWIRKLLDMVRAWYLLDVWKITAFLRVPCGSLRSHLSVMLHGQSENLIVASHKNLLNVFPTGFIQDFLMWNNFSLSTISENTSWLWPCFHWLLTESLMVFALFYLKIPLVWVPVWCLVALCSWILKWSKTQRIWHHSC